MKVVIPVGSLELGGGCKTLVDIGNALVAKGHEAEIVIPEGTPVVYDVRCTLTRIPTLAKEYIPYGDIVLPNYYITFAPSFEAWPTQCVRLCQGFEPYWVPDKDFAIWTYNHDIPVISISHWLDAQIFNHTGRQGNVVNLGVDPSIFYPSSQPLRLKKRRKKVILYVARDPSLGYAVKGFEEFYQSMRLINQKYKGRFIVYLICPENKLSLPGIAHRTFFPSSAQEMARLYRYADVFISTSRYEGFGLPLLEAMGCGTPVVTTDSGGVLDFSHHMESAYVTAPQNPREIARGIVKVLSSKALRRRLITGGLAKANQLQNNHFEHQIVSTLEEIYTQKQNQLEVHS